MRHALGLSPDHGPGTVTAALDHYVAFVGEVLDAAEWGQLTVEVGGRTLAVGSTSAHEARVRGDAFELLRCLSARRSKRQVLALEWTGAAEELVDVLERGFASTYAFRDNDQFE